MQARATITVTPPSFRFDLAIEEDLIEEVARVHGYDAVPTGLTSPQLTALAIDHQDRAWIGSVHGVTIIDAALPKPSSPKGSLRRARAFRSPPAKNGASFGWSSSRKRSWPAVWSTARGILSHRRW